MLADRLSEFIMTETTEYKALPIIAHPELATETGELIAVKPENHPEKKLSYEEVVHLPIQIHNVATKFIAHENRELYHLGPNKVAYMYHDAEKDSGIKERDFGHVGITFAVARAYTEATHAMIMDTLPNHPPERNIDPLQIYSDAEKFVRNDSELTYFWSQINADRKKSLTDLALLTAAAGHDLANVVEEDVDWDAIKQSGKVGKNFALYSDHQMHFAGVENTASQIYAKYVWAFKIELGLTNDEAKIVAHLGSEFIKETVFRGDAMENLAIIDQVGATMTPSALKGVFGLINENRIRTEVESNAAPQTFTVEGHFGGFIDWRFEVSEREGGVSMEQFVNHLDSLRRTNPVLFANILGVKQQDYINMRKIDNLLNFISTRNRIQEHVASKLWPKGTKIEYSKAYDGWNDPEFLYMDQSSELFRKRFWDPTLSLSDFDQLWNNIKSAKA